MALKLRKTPYYTILSLLTLGASTILGFLCFGGMYTLWPVLPLAATALVLSVVYEGEIYYQNIKGSLKKLTKVNFNEREVTNEYLLKHFPDDLAAANCPSFFKDYALQLAIVHKYSHKRLDKASAARKQQAEKKLRDMEKWFSEQLLARKAGKAAETPYEKEMAEWFSQQKDLNTEIDAALYKRRVTSWIAKGFSVLAGLFMTAGTTYLLVGTFTVLPMLAIPQVLLPAIVLPLAIIAGAAYAMLIYNAITDMIANDTIRKGIKKIVDDWKSGDFAKRAHAIFMGITLTLLAGLAVVLTICTAGTWWTIAKTAQPLFAWMSQMPSFIMGVINPIVVGIASIIFNIQNTFTTAAMIDQSLRPSEAVQDHQHKKKESLGFFARIGQYFTKKFNKLRAEQNWLQILNLPRILLRLVMIPLRIILFVGHIASMGVGDDRVPGIPAIVSAILSTISEIFEDGHYFMHIAGSHHHHHSHKTKDMLNERLNKEHSHNHDVDLPTRFLNLVFSPVFLLAASWNYLASQLNSDQKHVLDFNTAWEQQWGLKPEKSVQHKTTQSTSDAWRREQAVYRIDRFRTKHLQSALLNKDIALAKDLALSDLQAELKKMDASEIATNLSTTLTNAQDKNKEVFAAQRFFVQASKQTATQEFLATLTSRLS